ncbi:MAG TPA: serine hydrolase [Patescibacteria group bacterium]|nr:serine hydrolase [Patescibacteria group bacterium]
MDSGPLADAFDYVTVHQVRVHSLLIVRNGYVILDAYFWPFEKGELHDLASVTKSVTSSLIGIAIGQQKLSGVSEPLLTIFKERPIQNRDERKNRLRLEDLLTMSSGLDCHFDQGELTLSQMMSSSNWTQFMLGLPMVAEPGSHFEYCSGGMHLLSAVISETTGLSALEYARRELFQPLGIKEVIWPADHQGISHGWGDLHLKPADMAKLGYLWLNKGRWENRQLIPADWMKAAIQVHSHPGFSKGQEYGYGMWLYPHRTPPQFEALGRGGQRINIVPDKNLVVVFTGGEFEPGDIGAFIGRAIKSDEPLPENVDGAARLAAAIRGATNPPPSHPQSSLPAQAHQISGQTFILETNPLGLRSFTLTFPGGAEAQLSLEIGERRDGPRRIGLDGVPRISAAGRFGLPVALSGSWDEERTFILEYNEIGNINAYQLKLAFSDQTVAMRLSERSRVFGETRFNGKMTARRQ